MVLRGGKTPNYDCDSLDAAAALLAKAELPPRLMIDASHANSGKNHENQPKVVADLSAQIGRGERRIMGVMIESHLLAGRQDLIPGHRLVYGQSITDACIDWDTSVQLLEELAAAVRARREGAKAERGAPTARSACSSSV